MAKSEDPFEFPAPGQEEEEEGPRPVILSEIREAEELDLQTQLLADILDTLDETKNRVNVLQQEAQETFTEELSGSIFWPPDGGLGLLPAGKTEINLPDGSISLPDGSQEDLSNELTDFPVNVFQSVHFTPFIGRMAVEVVPPSGVSGYRGSQFFMDRQTQSIRHAPIRQVNIWTQFPGAVHIQLGASPMASTVTPTGVQGPVEYFGSLDTQDAFQGIVMRPVAVNPKTQSREVLAEDEARKNALLDAKAVEVPFSREQTWIVHNVGDNDADIRLQGATKPEDAAFNEDKSTGDSLTVTAGDSVTLNVDTFYPFMRIQGRSHQSGQATTLEADFAALGAV